MARSVRLISRISIKIWVVWMSCGLKFWARAVWMECGMLLENRHCFLGSVTLIGKIGDIEHAISFSDQQSFLATSELETTNPCKLW